MKQISKKTKKEKELELIIKTLEKYYSKSIKYSCIHCLKEAYNSILQQKTGYVTDEELIQSSNNTLKHK